MRPELNSRITPKQINTLTHLSSNGSIRFYWLNDSDPEFYAVNQNDLVIACFEFVERDDLQFAHMHISDNYQRQGIGKKIMRYAVEMYDSFLLPSTNKDDIYHYEGNGLNFIRSCFKDETLTTPPFEHPDSFDMY